MKVTTHPSNPPADAIDFKTQQSDGYEIASWKQATKPNVQNTKDAAYKVIKLGDQYLVVCVMRIPAKVNMCDLKKGTIYKLFDTDEYSYIVLGNYPTYVRYRVNVEGAKEMKQRKSFPPIMVTVINK
jgi:hypothetical protein